MITTEIITKEAELELLKEQYRIISKNLLTKVDHLLKKYFSEPYDAVISRRWFNRSWNQNGVDIGFEIGFAVDNNHGIDFASEVSFYYDLDKKQLTINHGTSGQFNKTDVYQFRRAFLIGDIHSKMETLEQEFLEIATNGELVTVDRAIDNLESDISVLKKRLEAEKIANIMNSFKVDGRLSYTVGCCCRDTARLFGGDMTITKITPKYVIVRSTYEYTKNIKKEQLADHINKGWVVYEV